MEMASDEKNIMANTESKGQKFVEKGSYVKSGTIIMKAEPFAVVLNSEYRGARCDTCFKSCKVLKCSGCQYVYYCGRNCQRKAWSVHKVECSSLKRYSPNSLWDNAHLMARIIIKLQNGGDKERGYYGSNEYRTFGDLMSHTTNIIRDRKRFAQYLIWCSMLPNFLPQEILPNQHELLTIYGRMTINSFTITDISPRLGFGLYLEPSMIDHSCKPNTMYINDGTTLVVRAMRDMPSFDWTKVSISYTEAISSVDERQEHLQNYYFQCVCDRCRNPHPVETAAACPNKSCTNPCFPDDLACSKCGQRFPPDFKDNFEMIMSRSLRYLDKKGEEPLLENLRACLAEQEGLLHPLNVFHIRILQKVANISTGLICREEAEVHWIKLLQKYEYYYGELHPVSVCANILLATLVSLSKKFEPSVDYINKTMDILKRGFGEDHPEVESFILEVFRKVVI